MVDTPVDLANLKPLIEVNDAEALGFGSSRNIRRLCEDGTLPAFKIGQRWKIKRDELLDMFGLVADDAR